MQTNCISWVAVAVSVAGLVVACSSSTDDPAQSSDLGDDGGAGAAAENAAGAPDSAAGGATPAESVAGSAGAPGVGGTGVGGSGMGGTGAGGAGVGGTDAGGAVGSSGAPPDLGGSGGASGGSAGTGGALPGTGGLTAIGGAGPVVCESPDYSFGGSMGTGGDSAASGGAMGSGGSGTGGSGVGGSASGVGGALIPPVGSAGAAGSDSGDTFIPVGTNPFTVATYDPLSTFAADVDTASYDIFRQYLAAGSLPQPASVRLEEYVNYFTYDYPAPAHDAEVPFSISLAAAPNILDRETVMLRVGIQGKAAPPFEKRPANLVFLVDVSGSMGSLEKLGLVREVLLLTLDELDATDTVSIVTYSTTAEVRLPPTPVSDRLSIELVINALCASGSTAGADGIGMAYEQAEAAFIDGGVNHVLMCTDGDFNVGPSSTDELVALIEEKRRTGITLTALGFGSGNLNDGMMEAITNAGNGVYGVITDSDQAARYVQERLLQGMTHIAKDMKLQVEFNPNEVYAYRLLGYENRAIADDQFRDDTVDAGEVGAGHRVTALYELVLPGTDIPLPEGAPAPKDGDAYSGEVEVLPTDLVLVKVRYKTLDATEDDPALEVSTSLAPADVAESYTALDGDFQWALVVASFSEILKESPYADPSQLDLMGQIIAGPDHAADPDRAEFVSLFGTARSLLGQ